MRVRVSERERGRYRKTDRGNWICKRGCVILYMVQTEFHLLNGPSAKRVYDAPEKRQPHQVQQEDVAGGSYIPHGFVLVPLVSGVLRLFYDRQAGVAGGG